MTKRISAMFPFLLAGLADGATYGPFKTTIDSISGTEGSVERGSVSRALVDMERPTEARIAIDPIRATARLRGLIGAGPVETRHDDSHALRPLGGAFLILTSRASVAGSDLPAWQEGSPSGPSTHLPELR